MKRTQLKRSAYHILGKADKEEEEEEDREEGGVSHDSHLKAHDPEIYDEDDLYHQVYIHAYMYVHKL